MARAGEVKTDGSSIFFLEHREENALGEDYWGRLDVIGDQGREDIPGYVVYLLEELFLLHTSMEVKDD